MIWPNNGLTLTDRAAPHSPGRREHICRHCSQLGLGGGDQIIINQYVVLIIPRGNESWSHMPRSWPKQMTLSSGLMSRACIFSIANLTVSSLWLATMIPSFWTISECWGSVRNNEKMKTFSFSCSFSSLILLMHSRRHLKGWRVCYSGWWSWLILLVVHVCGGIKTLIDRIRVVQCSRPFSFLNICDVNNWDLLQLIISGGTF